MMHKISRALSVGAPHFTPYYAEGFLDTLREAGFLDFTILGGRYRSATMAYLQSNQLPLDIAGEQGNYDLVVTCTDLIMQENIRAGRVVLVQEGMMEPETIMYHLVRKLNLPRFLANTSTTGLSNDYDAFCVASEGYRQLFIRRGVRPGKIAVTGIPNFDDVSQRLQADITDGGYVLVATSNSRETFKWDDRRSFILKAKEIAAGRKVIFKLHPNEQVMRAIKEIQRYAPEAEVIIDGDIDPWIAGCEVLITQYSSVVFVGLALGKEVHSYYDLEELRRLLPIQNQGHSADNIARICRALLATSLEQVHRTRHLEGIGRRDWLMAEGA